MTPEDLSCVTASSMIHNQTDQVSFIYRKKLTFIIHKTNNEGNTLNYIQSIPNHSATTSITRLLSCCVVNRFNPTFIKNSPEKTSPLPDKEELAPGIKLISFTRYILSASSPCKRTGNVFPHNGDEYRKQIQLLYPYLCPHT